MSGILLNWYSANKRELPWRETHDPYLVWISEVIMQQTRVNQGLAYYHRFAERFPSVILLAGASETEVLRYWQGLGYYSRARNLHKTAKIISQEYRGEFPRTSTELLKLPGIGKYTAAAIASIAFNEAVPVVDGNVARVISRLFGITENIQSPAGYRLISGIMYELMPGFPPGDFNQAVMEFGALHCTPASPGCGTCPLQTQCFAFIRNKVQELPARASKPEVRLRHFNYLVILISKKEEDFTLLNRRTGRDIWHNLYDFPSVNNEKLLSPEELTGDKEASQLLGHHWVLVHESEPRIHMLTHRKIIARFFKIRVSEETPEMKNYQMVKISGITDYPLPRLIEKYVQQHLAVSNE